MVVCITHATVLVTYILLLASLRGEETGSKKKKKKKIISYLLEIEQKAELRIKFKFVLTQLYHTYFSWMSHFTALIPVNSEQVTGGRGKLRTGGSLFAALEWGQFASGWC